MGIHLHIGSSEAEKKSKMGAVGNAYLVLYNVVQFLGWSHMLYILLPHLDAALFKGVDRGQLYSDIELSLQIFQTAAVLEVVHAAVGLVKTNPMLAMFQVSSRVSSCGPFWMLCRSRGSAGASHSCSLPGS